MREAAEGVACGPNKDLSCAVFAFVCFSASVKARLPHKDTKQPKKKKQKKKPKKKWSEQTKNVKKQCEKYTMQQQQALILAGKETASFPLSTLCSLVFSLNRFL